MSSKTNTIAANGARAAAPNVAAIATSANADGEMPMPGNARTSSSPANAPNVLLMIRIGASVPPDVPDPSAIHQMTSLPMHERGQRAEREPTGERVVDDVVADAEGARHEQPERRPHQRADDRMPRDAERQPAEHALDGEQPTGDEHGEQSAGEPERAEQRELAEAAEAVRWAP